MAAAFFAELTRALVPRVAMSSEEESIWMPDRHVTPAEVRELQPRIGAHPECRRPGVAEGSGHPLAVANTAGPVVDIRRAQPAAHLGAKTGEAVVWLCVSTNGAGHGGSSGARRRHRASRSRVSLERPPPRQHPRVWGAGQGN